MQSFASVAAALTEIYVTFTRYITPYMRTYGLPVRWPYDCTVPQGGPKSHTVPQGGPECHSVLQDIYSARLLQGTCYTAAASHTYTSIPYPFPPCARLHPSGLSIVSRSHAVKVRCTRTPSFRCNQTPRLEKVSHNTIECYGTPLLSPTQCTTPETPVCYPLYIYTSSFARFSYTEYGLIMP